MSVPQRLPTLGSISQPRGNCPCRISGDWIGAAPATPSASSTRRVAVLLQPGDQTRCRRPGGAAQAAGEAGAGRRASHRHRAPDRADRRCPGGGGPSGGADPPERRQGVPTALPRRRRQERSRRRLHAGRHPAHRRPPLPAAPALLGRDQGAARPGPRPRRPGRRARLPGQPPAQPAGRLLARRRRRLRRHRFADRAGLRAALPDAGVGRAPRREADEGVPRKPRLLRPPQLRPSCLPGCAPHRPAWPTRPKPRPRARWSAPLPPCSSAWSARSPG